MVTSVDLSGLKSQLESSAQNFSDFSKQLNPLVTDSVAAVAPSVKTLQDALPGASDSLTAAAKNIGTTINGVGLGAQAAMQNTLEKLSPNLSGLKEVAEGATNGLKSTLGNLTSPLKGIVDKISAEVVKIKDSVSSAISTLRSETQQGPSYLTQIITEVDDTSSVLAEYDEALAAYIFDPENNAPPEFPDENDLSVPALLTRARNNKDSAVDLSSGTISQVVHKIVGTIREIDTRSFTKAFLYDKASGEAERISEEMRAETGKTLSDIRSMSPK